MSNQTICQTYKILISLIGSIHRQKIVTLLSIVSIVITGCIKNNGESAAVNETYKRGQRLETIIKRGKLICGINEQLLGFSYKEPDGSYSGISVDLCRAIAAALFNDPTKVEFRHLKQEERFEAVTAGKVDILSRNTTWNLSRDTSGDMDFPPTNFYDGQGILVRQNSNITKLENLEGASICVPAQTTSEENLAEQMRKYRIGYLPMPLENIEQLYGAYDAQKCDAVTSDISELVARRSQLDNPNDHQLLDAVISKEPLGPVIANDEPAWLDVVTWVSYATIKAEELNVSSQNIDRLNNSKNAEIRRLIGIEGNIGNNLGLSNDFAKRVIKHVGNYDEIYERNIGEPFNLARGANALWKNGGLMHSPPFR